MSTGCDSRLITKDQLHKKITAYYEKQKYWMNKEPLVYQICGKAIKENADPEKIEYVKTQRGGEYYYHRRCLL